MYGLERTSAAADLPLTIDQLKAWSRVPTDLGTDDALLMGLLRAATDHVENATGRALVTQSFRMSLDRFPATDRQPIELARAPAQSVASVIYTAADGTATTWAADQYTVDTARERARLLPAYNVSWPSTRDAPNAVQVTFSAGYGGRQAVPEPLCHAIALLVGHLYEHREATVAGVMITTVPLAFDALIAPYRLPSF